MNTKGIFSHESDHWATPKTIYNAFMELGYVDPCPLGGAYDTPFPKYEGHKNIFINPPYSQISKWVEWALKMYEEGHDVVLLIPSRTDTKYFMELAKRPCALAFYKGRLKFNDGKNSAPFPSMLVILDHNLFYNQKHSFFVIKQEETKTFILALFGFMEFRIIKGGKK